MDKHRITLTLTALLAVLIICGLAILGQDWVQPEVTVPQIAEETGASQNQASIETDALAALPSVDLDGQPHAKREPVLASEVETAVLVTDIQGNPLAGFSLESRDWPRTRGWFNVEAGPPEISFLGVTDGDGLLDVSNQDPEAPLVLFSSDPSWAIIGESILPSSRQGLYGIRVREAGGVTGKVIAGGLPVSGATVGANVSIGFFQARTEGGAVASPASGDPGNERFALTDEQGRFYIAGMLPTRGRIAVLSPGFTPITIEFDGPEPGGLVDLGEIVLNPGKPVVIKLIGLPNSGIDSTLILDSQSEQYFQGWRGRPVDSSGEITYDSLPFGPYKWSLVGDKGLSLVGAFDLADGQTSLVIELPKLREVTVRAQDTSGQVIGALTAKVKPRKGTTSIFNGVGEVRILVPYRDDTRVSMEADGFAPEPKIKLTPTMDEVTFTMERTGTIVAVFPHAGSSKFAEIGLIAEKDSDLLVALEAGFSPVPMKSIPMHDSKATITEVAPGRYWLVSKTGALFKAFGPCTVKEGSIVSVDLTGELSTGLLAYVSSRETGIPCVGARVLISMGTSDPRRNLLTASLNLQKEGTLKTDDDGICFIPLEEGATYSIQIQLDGYRHTIEEFEVPLGPPLPVFIELDKSKGAPVKLEWMAGVIAKNAHISVRKRSGSKDEFLTSVVADKDGFLQISISNDGPFDFLASGQVSPGVTVSCLIPDIHLEVGRETEAIAWESIGFLDISFFKILNSDSTVRLRRDGIVGDSANFQIHRSLLSGVAPIAFPVGTYLAESELDGTLVRDTLTIEEGGVSGASLFGSLRTATIDLLGSDWRSAQVKFEPSSENVFPPFFIHLDRESSPVDVSLYGNGGFIVTLDRITHQNGSSTRTILSNEILPGAFETNVTFDLNELSLIDVTIAGLSETNPGPSTVDIFFNVDGNIHSNSTGVNSEGQFSIYAKGSPLLVVSEAKGFAPIIHQILASDGQSQTIHLEEKATLSVTVNTGYELEKIEIKAELILPGSSAFKGMISELIGAKFNNNSASKSGQPSIYRGLPIGQYRVSLHQDGVEVRSTVCSISPGETTTIEL